MEELDPLIAQYIYEDDTGELNDYARNMQTEFPNVDVEVFGDLRFGKENGAHALLGMMEGHFGAFEFSRMETALEKHMAFDGPAALPSASPTSSDDTSAPAGDELDIDLEALQQESNTQRFLDKASRLGRSIPSALLDASLDFGKDVVTQPITTLTGTVDNAKAAGSGVVNTVKDTDDVLGYFAARLDTGVGNMVARGVGALGNQGDMRETGWRRIHNLQRAIDAIPGPALGLAATGVRLPINSEEDREFYKSLGINVRNAKVGGSIDRSVNIGVLDKIAEHLGTTAEAMQVSGGETQVKETLNEVDTVLGAMVGDVGAFVMMTSMTAGSNIWVRAATDGTVGALSATDSDLGISEGMLQMMGFDENQVPDLLKTGGQQGAVPAMVRFIEEGTIGFAVDAVSGFYSKMAAKKFKSQEEAVAEATEVRAVVKEAAQEMEVKLKELADDAAEAAEEVKAKADANPSMTTKGVTPKTLEITAALEDIAEDIATRKPLKNLDDAAIDKLTGVRDFKNYPFLDTVGVVTAAIKTNIESNLKAAPTTVDAIVTKANKALLALRKEYPDLGALPKWALDEIDTGSQAADVLARIISIRNVNDQVERLGKYLSSGDAKTLEGMEYVAKAENPREMATFLMARLTEGAEDLNGVYAKIKRDWGQTGVILNKLKRGIDDADTQARLDRIIKRELKAGYIKPEDMAKRFEELKNANAHALNKYAGANKGGLLETLSNSQYSSLLMNHVTMMVNVVSESARTMMLGTVAPIANAIDLFRRGNVKKAAVEAGRLAGQVVLAPKQLGKVLRNVETVWRTGMGEMSRELTPYTAKTNRPLTLGEVFGERAARETLAGKVATVPLRTVDLMAAITIRTMGSISETFGTIFHGANVDYSTITGQFGKKWQEKYLRQGGLSVDDITAMLKENDVTGRQTMSGQLIDDNYASLSDAARFQDQIASTADGLYRGSAVGSLERWYNQASSKHAALKWAVPFFGIGLRITEETMTAAIPGLAFLRGTIAKNRMNHPNRYVANAWKYYYGAMQVNLMMGVAQGIKDYMDTEEGGIPALPTEVGEKTEAFQPISGKFGQFGGGIVSFEKIGKDEIRRVEEKSLELMDGSTTNYIARNLGYHLALVLDDTDAVEAGEALTRLMSSQLHAVLGASIARTLPSEFSKITGQEGGTGVYDWILNKIGAQVPLGSGYRNAKLVYKERFGDPTWLSARFEDGFLPYNAERVSWIGDLAKALWPAHFVAMNKDLGFAGVANPKGRRGSIDPTTKVTVQPRSVIIANWVSEQQNRKMIREEWKVPGTEVLLRDLEGPNGFSMFTEVMEHSGKVRLPHPDNPAMMLTIVEYMDMELENPDSQLRRNMAQFGLTGDAITRIVEGTELEDDEPVAALEGGNVVWDFIKETQQRYNDIALADIIHNQLSKKQKEELLLSVEMTTPEYWYEQFSPQTKAQLNLIGKGEATYSEGEFGLLPAQPQ